MKRTVLFWAACAIAFIFFKLVFSGDLKKDFLGAAVAHTNDISVAQIKQIEGIARDIAIQSNANKQAMIDEMTVSFNAVATGTNVRFESVIRTKMGLTQNKIEEWINATRSEIIPRVCAQNTNNPAFDRGLSYTFSYSNTYSEKLGNIFIDKATCENIGQ